MENEVMGEKLKGLHNSIHKLLGTSSIISKLTEEFDKMLLFVNKLAKNTITMNSELKEVVYSRDSVLEDYYQIASIRTQLSSQKENLAKLFKEKTTFLQKKWEESENVKEGLRQELIKLEKRHKDLTEEYIKLRQRMKQFKFNSSDQADEKICKMCSKIYFENENFNWSCRIHPSEWSGEIYWCCGKTAKDLPGCRTAKHLSKEENEDIMNEEERDKMKILSTICSSCRHVGHLLKDCPKDPNARTKYEPNEELVRIKENTSKKKKGPGMNEERSAIYMQLLKKKLGSSSFAEENYTSESEPDSRQEVLVQSSCFRDISKYRTEYPKLEETLIEVERIRTKELDREEALTKV